MEPQNEQQERKVNKIQYYYANEANKIHCKIKFVYKTFAPLLISHV